MPSPWINDNIRSLKRDCRRVERLWKSTRLSVHYFYMKELLMYLNNAVKDARTRYFRKILC